MDYSKIEKIEQEIKNLHYNPKISNHSLILSEAETKELYQDFWDIHIKPVIEYSKTMALKYGADLEVVWLGAIMHDIAKLDDVEPHEEIGSQMAYKLLIENDFSEDIAEKVRAVVLSHRVTNYLPENLEQKIVASADAMAHFLQPFYFWIARYFKKDFSKFLIKNSSKIERDFNDKIFFEDEKKMVEAQYKVLKNWFTSAN